MAENNQNMNATQQVPSQPITMSSRIFGMHDAKRMSFDENMPVPQYGSSPLSSLLSQSPGGTTNPAGFNQGRRDSLKNMWHLQDFGTTD